MLSRGFDKERDKEKIFYCLRSIAGCSEEEAVKEVKILRDVTDKLSEKEREAARKRGENWRTFLCRFKDTVNKFRIYEVDLFETKEEALASFRETAVNIEEFTLKYFRNFDETKIATMAMALCPGVDYDDFVNNYSAFAESVKKFEPELKKRFRCIIPYEYKKEMFLKVIREKDEEME